MLTSGAFRRRQSHQTLDLWGVSLSKKQLGLCALVLMDSMQVARDLPLPLHVTLALFFL